MKGADVRFPKGFIWGVGTSAYQVEGAVDVDGRGESIWDHFCQVPGRILDGSSGARACDHYRRFREDVALMRDMGVKAYRFSTAWPRVMPNGTGPVNEKGLDFYSRLVDELLASGIKPFVTLYHWDLPLTLQREGGWEVRATAQAFAEYVRVVARHLGDRVTDWITINEPWCSSFLSHQIGLHAPGLQDWEAAVKASHHLLLAHGLAVRQIRAAEPGCKVGIAVNLLPVHPASNSLADAEAARLFDGHFNRWFLDPLFGRGYPSDVKQEYERKGRLPSNWSAVVRADDLKVIAEPTDFLGINYYNRAIIRSDEISEAQNAPQTVLVAPREEWTDMGWEIYPIGLHEILTRVHRDYAPPCIYVTENGASYGSPPPSEGRVRDVRRIAFLREHLLAAHRALSDGVPLEGYFHWSLLDNFEWERGYTQRFGLVWVNFESQQRILKDSGSWYAQVVRTNSVSP